MSKWLEFLQRLAQFNSLAAQSGDCRTIGTHLVRKSQERVGDGRRSRGRSVWAFVHRF